MCVVGFPSGRTPKPKTKGEKTTSDKRACSVSERIGPGQCLLFHPTAPGPLPQACDGSCSSKPNPNTPDQPTLLFVLLLPNHRARVSLSTPCTKVWRRVCRGCWVGVHPKGLHWQDTALSLACPTTDPPQANFTHHALLLIFFASSPAPRLSPHPYPTPFALRRRHREDAHTPGLGRFLPFPCRCPP